MSALELCLIFILLPGFVIFCATVLGIGIIILAPRKMERDNFRIIRNRGKGR